MPIRRTYRPTWVKLCHDRVAIAVGTELVAEHPPRVLPGAKVLDALHVLPLIEALAAQRPFGVLGSTASR